MKRPPCPKCGGRAKIRKPLEMAAVHINTVSWVPCPECMEDPGLASMDRIMAIANGVIDDVDEHGTGTWQSVREYLMHAELAKRDG